MHAACTNDHSHWPLYQVQLGPKIVSALWYIEGPDFRCSFYTDSMGKAFGTNEVVRIIMGVRISKVSRVGGSTVWSLFFSNALKWSLCDNLLESSIVLKKNKP